MKLSIKMKQLKRSKYFLEKKQYNFLFKNLKLLMLKNQKEKKTLEENKD